MKKHKTASFSMTQEALSKLHDIKQKEGHQNSSETVRHCIDVVYELLFHQSSAPLSKEVLALSKRTYALLRFLHIEQIKNHQGKLQPLSKTGLKYLKNLQTEMKTYVLNLNNKEFSDDDHV